KDAIPLPALPKQVARWAYLRRWEQSPHGKTPTDDQPLKHSPAYAPPADDGALLVIAPNKDETDHHKGWLGLENEIQVLFETDKDYHPGDYWLIPARTASADILWPREEVDKDGKKVLVPQPVSARNTVHWHAPLAVVDPTAPDKPTECRRKA